MKRFYIMLITERFHGKLQNDLEISINRIQRNKKMFEPECVSFPFGLERDVGIDCTEFLIIAFLFTLH